MADGGCREQVKPADHPGRHRLDSQPSSRTGENSPYGMIGGIEETSASFEARSAPRSYPTKCMVRPCVARGFRRSVGSSVLHQCIRPLIGACAPGHHGYQRACVLISGQASSGPFGSPVFACAGKTGPPSLLILSQTSAGNGICYFIITCSLSVQFLCSCPEAGPSSRPAG